MLYIAVHGFIIKQYTIYRQIDILYSNVYILLSFGDFDKRLFIPNKMPNTNPKSNTNEREKKTPGEIKEKILEALNDKPLNAQEISKVISSNWSTVKNYVEELGKEKKGKEIFFGEKNIIYQNITEDTYYNIPIKAEQRKILKFIFSNAIPPFSCYLSQKSPY